MRLQMFEHMPSKVDCNITRWAEINGQELSRTKVNQGQSMPDLDSFDWLIVMGGPQSAWEYEKYPWLKPERDFIRHSIEAGKIVLAICFGVQILAEALESRAFRNEHREFGWHDVSVLPEGRKSFLFYDIPDTFVTWHSHSDHYELPQDCVSLAESGPSPNQAFMHNSQPIVGLQFHPETTIELAHTSLDNYKAAWKDGPYVKPKEEIRAQTSKLKDNYWLMKALLDNIIKQYG